MPNRIVSVPESATILILPISGDAHDDGAAIIDAAIALHHVVDQLDVGDHI